MIRGLGLVLALGMAAPIGCKHDDAGAGEGEAIAIGATVMLAPVADQHPWVIAFLTHVSLAAPAGVEAQLEGRTEAGGRRFADPVFRTEDRATLDGALSTYEATHPRPPELTPAWERLPVRERGPSWQLHFIDRAAGFELDAEARASIVDSPIGPQVLIRFSAAQRERFATLTGAYVDRRVAMVVGDEVVMVPIVREPIVGGAVQITTTAGDDPAAAAKALLDRLKPAK